MLKNNRRIKIFGGLIVLCLIVYIFTAFFFRDNENGDMLSVTVYFLNKTTNRIEQEERLVPIGENHEVAGSVLNLIYEGPHNKNLSKTIPDNVRILEQPRLIGNKAVFELEFSPEYYEMDEISEAFFRASFVWTMTSLHFINDVHIYVDGQELVNSTGDPLGLLNRENVVINPQISPVRVQSRLVKLYFIDQESQQLVAEERNITYPDQYPDKYIIEQLIKGPTTDGLSPTIPPETKIRDVKREDTGTCYVNLSSDFITKHGGGAQMENLTVYSIVNSLTELSGINKVQFMIESASVSEFKGTVDLSKTFEKNEDLILER